MDRDRVRGRDMVRGRVRVRVRVRVGVRVRVKVKSTFALTNCSARELAQWRSPGQG